MLVLTGYYSEVRQHLEGGERHGHHVDMHCSSLTQHGGETSQAADCVSVCVCVAYMCVYHTVPCAFALVTARVCRP